jgi:integrase
MSNKIEVAMQGGAASLLPAQLEETVREYRRRSRADSTIDCYGRTAALFEAWCRWRGLQSLPATPKTVELFMAEMASVGPDYVAMGWKANRKLRLQAPLKPATINKVVSAIAFLHRSAGYSFDRELLDATRSGIARTHGTAERRVHALTDKELRRAVAQLPDTLRGLRDRAILLIGFAAALRRSELVGLDLDDGDGTGVVEIIEDGIRITLKRSKTDQEGAGQTVAIPRDHGFGAIAALEAWLSAAGITSGAIFRPVIKGGKSVAPRAAGGRLTTHAVAIIIKDAVKAGCIAGGMSETKAEDRAKFFSGHSLRAGFATSAASYGVTGENIARQTRHKSTQMVQRYVREAELFTKNPLKQMDGG